MKFVLIKNRYTNEKIAIKLDQIKYITELSEDKKTYIRIFITQYIYFDTYSSIEDFVKKLLNTMRNNKEED